MTQMRDLALFEARAGAVGGAEHGLLFIDARKLPPSIFASVNDVEKARSLLKRTKYLHMSVWWVDAGLARRMADEDCTMVIGISDFLDGAVHERAKRLARARKMAELVLHFGGRVRVASLARREEEMRNALELLCFADEMGIGLKAAKMELEREVNACAQKRE